MSFCFGFGLLLPATSTHAQSAREATADSAAALLSEANGYADSGSGDKAAAAYRQVVKSYQFTKEAETAQFRLAQLLQKSGNTKGAFEAYQTLLKKYPQTQYFDKTIAEQIRITNDLLQSKPLILLGMNVFGPWEKVEKMYQTILSNAPYSKQAPIAQFNLGITFEREGKTDEAIKAYQTVIDKYPSSDIADDAMYQIGYVYQRLGMTGRSQDLSALVMAQQTYEDFLAEYPNSEKAAQARENLKNMGLKSASDLTNIAKFYEHSKDYKAAVIYYNDTIRRQPDTKNAEVARTRIQELRSQFGDEALSSGPQHAETGEKAAQRRRLQSEVETSALTNYLGPPKRDVVPDELPTPKPRMRTSVEDVKPLPPVEPALPTQ
ncbi:MAG: outer membrane protein assembly factor BamD [Chthoniobacterales bacterium]